MTTPNFGRGAPTTSVPGTGDNSWVAKYPGECDYCGIRLVEGTSRVRWNAEGTKVICAKHRG